MQEFELPPMDKLKLILGPAPSEMPFGDLVEMCKREIQRTNLLLMEPPKKSRKSSKASRPRIKKSELSELSDLLSQLKGENL